jgi:ATP-dependent helicase HrpB
VPRVPLPIDDVLGDLEQALRAAPAVVLKAPPGAGKTTRVPVALTERGLVGDGLVLVLEPRRVAARAAATRMAQERGERAGESVGYQVRFEEKRSRDTRVLVVTEGLLTRRFLDDPTLDGVAAVVLDEFHERSVHTDLCLAMTRELLELRDDLKLVVMSATIDAAPLAAWLGDCPVIASEGRTFPLTVTHAPRDERPLEIRVRAALYDLMSAPDDDGGDALVFLPGAREIRRCQDALRDKPPPGAPDVLPLYGALRPEEQDKALTRGPRRRVVLATNLAETSLTLEGVTIVVDSGLRRVNRYSPRTGLERLDTARISRWSAEQRAGRAGRTAPGRVLRLWTTAEHAQLHERDEPELRRCDLAPVLLQTLAFQPGDPRASPFYTPPPDAALARARELLVELDATEPDGDDGLRLTDRGRALAALPVHPRTGALLMAARAAGQAHVGATAAALLEGRDVATRDFTPPPGEGSDLFARADALDELEDARFDVRRARALGLDARGAREAARVRGQLERLTRRLPAGEALDEHVALSRALLAGFPDRLAQSTGEREGRLFSGRGVEIARSSCVSGAPLFVALDVDDGRGARSLVRLAHPVEERDVREALAHLVVREETAVLEGERGTVTGVVRERVGAIVLDEKRGVRVEDDVAARALADAAAERDDLVRLDEETERLLLRVRFAAQVFPGEGLPALDDAFFRARIEERAHGCRSLAELRAVDWRAAIEGALTWPQRKLLDDEVPDRVEVPSGSRVRIDYAPAFGPEEAPVLAVRLQEVFGWPDTPRIARGRVPLLLHLLAPNMRPAQVTQDLAGFWRGTYSDVRKDLRARYPKHSWPEDPSTAKAERRPRRKR